MMKRDPVSKACDVYSYGILCWELLSQEKPFSHVIPQYMVLFEVLKGEVSCVLIMMSMGASFFLRTSSVHV